MVGDRQMPLEGESPPCLEDLLQDWRARRQRGEPVSIDGYAQRYPEFAGVLRELLSFLEQPHPTPMPACSSRSTPPGILLPGVRIGEYRLVRYLGQGGMGIVYQAHQESLGRSVAIKLLWPADGASASRRADKRFRREIETAARLRHPNIVPILDSGHWQPDSHTPALAYYVMPLIDGEPLSRVLAREVADHRLTPKVRRRVDQGVVSLEPQRKPGMPLDRVVDIGIQVAGAIDHAARAGVFHRDIKPGNLLMDAEGNVLVTDFGLARAAWHDSLTHSQEVVGTLRYMAPERFWGQQDVRSDLYALGLTLVELLSAQPAFAGRDRAQLVQQVVHGPPLRLAKRIPHLPGDLVQILEKAIARRAEDRYPSGAALAADLRRFQTRRPIQARPVGPLGRIRRWVQRYPWAAGLMGFAVMKTMAFVLTVIVLARPQWLGLDSSMPPATQVSDPVQPSGGTDVQHG